MDGHVDKVGQEQVDFDLKDGLVVGLREILVEGIHDGALDLRFGLIVLIPVRNEQCGTAFRQLLVQVLGREDDLLLLSLGQPLIL